MNFSLRYSIKYFKNDISFPGILNLFFPLTSFSDNDDDDDDDKKAGSFETRTGLMSKSL